jgi:hypothetical protein
MCVCVCAWRAARKGVQARLEHRLHEHSAVCFNRIGGWFPWSHQQNSFTVSRPADASCLARCWAVMTAPPRARVPAPATANADVARKVSVGGVLGRVLSHLPWRAVLAYYMLELPKALGTRATAPTSAALRDPGTNTIGAACHPLHAYKPHIQGSRTCGAILALTTRCETGHKFK